MSGEVLSQAEIESLMRARRNEPADDAGTPESKATDDASKKVTWQPVSPAVRSVHEKLAKFLASGLSGLVRTTVDVRLANVDQLSYSEFAFSLDNPTCFCLLSAQPLTSRWVLEISPAILYPIIDRLLGGGREVGVIARRPLTEIELRLVARINRQIVEQLQHAWHELQPLRIAVERVETSPLAVQVVPPAERMVLIGFEVEIGAARGMLQLCLPAATVEQIGRETTLQNSHDAFSAKLVVQVAKVKITRDELANLAVGDMIATEQSTATPLQVMLNGQAKFHAHPGTLNGRKAIRIEKSC